MGVVLVVVLEGDGQVANGCAGIGLRHEVHVVTLHGPDERLCHAIALGTTHWCIHRLQAHIAGESHRLPWRLNS